MLQQELDSTLNQERDIWALKSRVNWLVDGERNTSFFHVTTLVRRKRNWIDTIKNTVGEWVFEEEDIMNVIHKGFQDLFSSSNGSTPWPISPPSQWQVRLTEVDCADLNSSVTDEEIIVALRSMKPHKAPGLERSTRRILSTILADSGFSSQKGSKADFCFQENA